MLHILPLEGLNDELINVFRRFDGAEHKFVVSSSLSAVIKYCPSLMAIKGLIYLSEPSAKDKNKLSFEKELLLLIDNADKVLWHSLDSTNKRFYDKFVASASDSDKHIWCVFPNEAYRVIDFVEKSDKEVSNVFGFSQICFLRDVDAFSFNKLPQGKNIKCNVIDTPPNFNFIPEFKEYDNEYQIAHFGFNVQIGYNYNFKNHYTLYQDFSKVCKHKFVPYYIMQSGVFCVEMSKSAIQHIRNTRINMQKNKLLYRMPLYDYRKEKFEIYCDLSSIDCVVLDLNPPYGLDYISMMLKMGKQIYFPNGCEYIDYLTQKGFTVFSFSKAKHKSSSQMKKSIPQNTNHYWFMDDEFKHRYLLQQFEAFFNDIKTSVENGGEDK